MSLLMDALKKAEQAKSGGSAPEAPAADAPAAPEVANPAPATLPDLPLELEALDQDFTAEARATPAPSQRPATGVQPPPVIKPAQPSAAERAAAQNAFAAKLPPAPDRTFAIVVGAATLIAVAAIGIYFWLQLKPASGGLATAPIAGPSSARMAPAAVPAPPARALDPLPRTAELPSATTPPMRTKPAAAPVEAPAMSSLRTGEAIRITTSHLATDPALSEGFAAFQAGDLKKARAAYERALQDDPRNADALRGAAAVALREGRGADAESYYRRLVDADPLDATAQAGLVGLGAQDDPVAAESRLKTLLAGQPEATVLHFALGNLYARQSRWGEAQQAYFDAVAGDGGNPDYLYNLAVSLDQLHKASLAAQYYRQALAAAAKRPAEFDQAAATARLRQLQPR